jgi:hypothetical protein
MKFKVIKNIPNFNIGDIINTKDNLGFHPELYSDIFEKIVVTEIKTMYDFIVEKYDKIYTIMKELVKIILALTLSLLFWYLAIAFIYADMNIWNWEKFVRCFYIIISIITAGKSLDD